MKKILFNSKVTDSQWNSSLDSCFLSSKILSAQEEERKKISSDIHDELGQSLAMMKCNIIRSIKKNSDASQEILTDYHSILASVEKMIVDMRRITKYLSPYIVEDLGLSAALEWLVDSFSAQHGMISSISTERISHQFTIEEETNIYRIFQEALTNISKYASAERICFSIIEMPDSLTFSLEDDGVGFEMEKTYGGLGFATMRERANVVGAKLAITSCIGVGTKIVLSIPI